MNPVDKYISKAPQHAHEKLSELRSEILKLLPDAEEVISYNMPAFRWNGKCVVYYAANKNHLGFYPTSAPIVAFQNEIARFKSSKGAIQLPYDQPLPLTLIRKIVNFRKKQITGKK